MQTSCVSHKSNDPIIIIRQSYIDLCDGNRNAAILMSYFEYWHNVKKSMAAKNQSLNDVAVKHGDEPVHDTSLYQWHTRQEIYDSCFHMVAINKIKEACLLLEEKGYISLHKNPNPKYSFDRTIFYLFHPERVNSDLNKTCDSYKQNVQMAQTEHADGPNETCSSNTEITTENTTENIYTPDFLEVWQSCPRGKRSNKKLAAKRWKALTRRQRARVIESIPIYQQYCKDNGWYQPQLLQTYLNGKNENWESFLDPDAMIGKEPSVGWRGYF